MQAVVEVLNKSRFGNSQLQIRQNPITVADHYEHGLFGYFRLVLHHSNEKKLFDFWNFFSRLNLPAALCEAEAFAPFS